MALLVLFVHLTAFFWTTTAFNLETTRPILYRVPSTGDGGSYFGMSVAIRPNANNTWSVQIGAPKGHGGGKGVPGPGTLCRCGTRGPCRTFPVDEEFPAIGGRGIWEFREKKDEAWIGVAMDVRRYGSRETSVVCGHRWMNQNLKNPENIDVTYLVTGVCYLEDLNDVSGTSSRRLLPLANKDKIYTPTPYVVDLSTYHWGLGQAGISVRIVEAPWQILIGAPGVTHWVGSVIRYDETFRPVVANFARTEIARQSRYPYLGYSVSFGRFYKDEELWYVAGAPRSANYRGQIFTFQFKGSSDDVRVQSSFTGATFGEYFGSSLATTDLNTDGFDDIIVGAPLFSSRDPDEGRIYVFLGTGRGNFLVPAQVINGRAGQARFGSCVASIGDLDQDGYGDVAVGAPYEDDNKGAVYIYRGFSKGLRTEYSQRIGAKDVHPELRGFGVSISNGVDVDGNRYVDVAVGSYLSGHVVLMRSRPVVSLHPKIRTEDIGLIDRRDTHFNVTVCSRFSGQNAPDHLDIVRTIDVDAVFGRGKLDPKSSSHRKSIRLRANQVICEIHSVLLNVSRKNFSPLLITVRNEIVPCSNGGGRWLLVEGERIEGEDDFPKDCPFGNKAEASKEVAFAGVCGSDLMCRSDLHISCNFLHLRGSSYILGSTEFLILSMEVKNEGEAAFETKIKIWSNLRVGRRQQETTAESSRKTHWIYHEGILTESYKTNFSFEIDLRELTEEDSYLNLMAEVSTSSSETDLENNRCKISVKLESDASLLLLSSSSNSSAYITTAALQEETVNVTHYYEIEKSGVTPLKDIELTIHIPFSFGQDFLLFEVETSDWMHFSRQNEKATLPESEDGGFDESNSKENCPPTNRTLFLNCSTPETECQVLKIFFPEEVPPGFSSYVKILITLNVSALDSVKREKDIVYLSTTGVLKFSKFLERNPRKVQRSASISLYDEERESHVEAHVVALSILAGGFLLSLIVTGLVKSNFFKRAKKEELKALKDADASILYFATGDNFQGHKDC